MARIEKGLADLGTLWGCSCAWVAGPLPWVVWFSANASVGSAEHCEKGRQAALPYHVKRSSTWVSAKMAHFAIPVSSWLAFSKQFFLCLVLALEKGWTFQPAFNTRWIMSDHTKQVLCNEIRPASSKGGCYVVYSCIAYVFPSISDMFRVSSGKATKFPNSKGCAPAGSFSSESLTCWLVELDRNGLERFCAAHNLQPSEMTSKCMK